MRVRKKILVLHTCFSLALAIFLLIALRPSVLDVAAQAELNEGALLLRQLIANSTVPLDEERDPFFRQRLSDLRALPGIRLEVGSDSALGLPAGVALEAASAPGEALRVDAGIEGTSAVMFVPRAGASVGAYHLITVLIPEARRAIRRLYALTVVALLAVYALVAAALEVFVLPQNVYIPIQRMLDADAALQEGRRESELIPAAQIPADELGEIMRSRNASIEALRQQETALADALRRLEEVAADLKRKNHLLETARRNLADADRLASLGMMSAGIAHELNTPLAVLKGLVEQLQRDPTGHASPATNPAQAALMLRVVGRLERLGESLLDFARVRAPRTAPTSVRWIVDEAATLVRLDRDAAGVELVNDVGPEVRVGCDADRMVQVLVNLLRNAVDALRDDRSGARRITVGAEPALRDGRPWLSLTVTDNGPGIDPDILSRIFDPFVTTRLDARGTGLGLAVAEGIVREHGGLLLARNLASAAPGRRFGGAVFEIMLPMDSGGSSPPSE